MKSINTVIYRRFIASKSLDKHYPVVLEIILTILKYQPTTKREISQRMKGLPLSLKSLEYHLRFMEEINLVKSYYQRDFPYGKYYFFKFKKRKDVSLNLTTRVISAMKSIQQEIQHYDQEIMQNVIKHIEEERERERISLEKSMQRNFYIIIAIGNKKDEQSLLRKSCAIYRLYHDYNFRFRDSHKGCPSELLKLIEEIEKNIRGLDYGVAFKNICNYQRQCVFRPYLTVEGNTSY